MTSFDQTKNWNILLLNVPNLFWCGPKIATKCFSVKNFNVSIFSTISEVMAKNVSSYYMVSLIPKKKLGLLENSGFLVPQFSCLHLEMDIFSSNAPCIIDRAPIWDFRWTGMNFWVLLYQKNELFSAHTQEVQSFEIELLIRRENFKNYHALIEQLIFLT